MKRLNMLLAVSLLLPLGSAIAQDKPIQEKPGNEEPQVARVRRDGPQLKVQMVFAEYDGDKKVKSLPYTLLVLAGIADGHSDVTKMRLRSKVPIYLGTSGAPSQYAEVGTNIDCQAWQAGDGTYRITLNLVRFWAEADSVVEKPNSTPPSEKTDTIARTPITRQFDSESTVTIRDGQTLETNFATDPVTSKVIRLEVTVNALKLPSK
jgi:hypothetical protein